MNISRYRWYLITVSIVLVILIVPAMGSMSAPMNARDLTGINMEGIDHWYTVANTAQDCANLCDKTPGCEGATFVLPNTIQGPDPHCWRKSVVTGDVENFNCISFKKQAAPPGGGCSMSHPRAGFDISAPPGSTKTDPAELSSMAPLTLQFTDQSTGAKNWLWDFGDGSPVSSEQNPQHTFMTGSLAGSKFLVTLTVTGSCLGETNSFKTNVTVFDNIGALALASNPGSARVVIDGVDSLKTTDPQGKYLMFDLMPGYHTIRLTLDGYKDYFGSVTITNGRMLSLTPVLEKIPTTTPTTSPPITTTSLPVSSGTGSITVSSTPSGASVNLDGWDKGITPVTLEQVKTGTHTLTLKKTGYLDSVQTVMVAGGSTTQVNVQLVPQDQPLQPSGSGTLIVSSIPGGASVYMDGGKIGTTPVTAYNVTAGTHNLILTLQNYHDISQTVEITSGSEKEVSIDFSGENNSTGFPLSLVLAAGALIAVVLVIVLVMRAKKKDR